MDTVRATYVRFAILNKQAIANEAVPIVESVRDLTSTELHDPDGQCKRCYPTTSYCRGHMGKILFRHYHIYYPYRRMVDKMLSMICGSCYLPVRESRSPKSPTDKAKYIKLVEYYNHASCICTGEQESHRGYAAIHKLRSLYKVFHISGSCTAITNIFSLPNDVDEVLRNYVMVLPAMLLSALPGGSAVSATYRKILETYGPSSNAEECMALIYKLYGQYSTMLRDKAGVIRQTLLPRKAGNSIRAVIISDTGLGISDIGVSRTIGDKICRAMVVSKENYQHCVDTLCSGRVSHVSYGKQRYKVASPHIYLVLVGIELRVEIPQGVAITTMQDGVSSTWTYHPNNLQITMQRLRYAQRIEVEGMGTIASGVEKEPIVYIDVVPRASIHSQRIPLRHWMQVDVPAEGEKVLVHRNPVLSAGSIQMHKIVSHGVSEDVSMTLEQRQLQREHIDDNIGKLILVGRNNIYRGPANTRRAQWCGDMIRGNPNYRLSSSVNRTISRDRDVDCCISLNPVVTSTYQADYDGDEMNLAYMGDEPGGGRDISVVSSLLKGLIGPIHDAKHGLYCLVTNSLGLSHLQQSYVETILSLTSDDGTYTKDKLADIGFSSKQAAELTTICPNGVGKRDISKYLEGTRYVSLTSTTKLVEDLIVGIRLSPDRMGLLTNVGFNSYILDQVPNTCSEYMGLSGRDLISAVYVEVISVLYAICDYCGISYDRLSRDSIVDVERSRARPSKDTINSIYGHVGYATAQVAGSKVVSYVSSSYSEGVTQLEFDRLCYSARVQVVRKAETTAPEGDNMRLQCNYLSNVRKVDTNRWEDRGEVFCEYVDQNYVRDFRTKASSHFIRTYSRVLGDDAKRMEYQSHDMLPTEVRSRRRNLIHMGQRKLLMSEIEFLTEYATTNTVVVYAGAAPGSHIPILLDMFPSVIFHLYDNGTYSSNLFDKVSNNPRKGLEVYERYLDADTARAYRHKGNILLISDIRTNTNKSRDAKPTDEDVSRDNATNVAITKAMDPEASLLKFRLPYSPGHTAHLEGELRLQSWSGHESTEVRLLCKRPYRTIYYDHTEHEEKMFYHNMLRPLPIVGRRVNGNITRRMGNIGITHHYDMYRESEIVAQYVAKYRDDESRIYRLIDNTLGQDLRYYLDKREV